MPKDNNQLKNELSLCHKGRRRSLRVKDAQMEIKRNKTEGADQKLDMCATNTITPSADQKPAINKELTDSMTINTTLVNQQSLDRKNNNMSPEGFPGLNLDDNDVDDAKP